MHKIQTMLTDTLLPKRIYNAHKEFKVVISLNWICLPSLKLSFEIVWPHISTPRTRITALLSNYKDLRMDKGIIFTAFAWRYVCYCTYHNSWIKMQPYAIQFCHFLSWCLWPKLVFLPRNLIYRHISFVYKAVFLQQSVP